MIYLDNNATTKAAPEVVAEMLPFLSESYQNASSVAGEVFGVKRAMSRARVALASLLGAGDPSCLAFTSGATESNNWVINAIAEATAKPGHLVTSSIEHSSVLEPMRRLERRGWRLTVLPVNADGVVRLDHLRAALCPDTALVSIMAANNETAICATDIGEY